MKAIIDGAVVADAPESDLISIDGNYYFPPSSIRSGVLSDSPTPYTCPWKGVAQYHESRWMVPLITTQRGVTQTRTRRLSTASARTTAAMSPSTSSRS
jgi:Domain of unknown function (DUF427)